LPKFAVLGLKALHAGFKHLADRLYYAFVRAGCHRDIDRTRARIVVNSDR
jgi:hypothetical protein